MKTATKPTHESEIERIAMGDGRVGPIHFTPSQAAHALHCVNALPACIAAMEAIVAHDDDLHTPRGSLFPLALMDQIGAALAAAKGDA